MKLLKFMFYFTFIIIIVPTLFSQEEENDSIIIFRENWFYGQRQFPFESIPINAYSNAIQHKENLTSSQGFFLDVPFRWASIGPKPILNGQGGNNSGRGSFIKYDPNNGSVLYLGAGNGGIWKSTNVGDTWQPITDGLPSLSSGAIAINYNNSNTMYYGTGEAVFGVIYKYFGLGIFKTYDRGESWFQLSGGLPTAGTQVYKILIDPGDTNKIFAAMNSGFWRSTNGGSTWTRVTGSTDLMCTDAVISSTNSNLVFCAGPKSSYNGVGYRRSTDNGVTFIIENDALFQPVSRTELAITSNNIIYAVTNEPNMKIYRSTNGIGTNFEIVSCLHDGFIQVDYDLFLEINPRNPDVIFSGDKHLFKSSNGGFNFNFLAGYWDCITCCASRLNFSDMHPDFHAMDFSSSNSTPNQIAILNDGGVWTSPDLGVTWHNNNLDLSTTMIYDFSTAANNKEIVISGVQDIGYIIKNQNMASWNVMRYGFDGGKTLISRFNQNHRLVIDNLYGSFSYTVDGNVWSSNASLMTNTVWEPNDGDWIAPFIEHPSQPDVIYTARRNDIGGIRVFKSLNFGQDFTVIADINGFSLPPQDMVIFDKQEPELDILYLSASHYSNTIPLPTELFKSSDGGETWNDLQIVADPVVPKRFITDIEIDDINPNEIYITLSGFDTPGEEGHVFKSIDGGINWTNISGNLSGDAPVNNIEVYYWGPGANDKRYIVASDNGVYTSNDLGQSWVALATGLPNTVVTDMELHELSGYLRASTFGRGVFEINFETPFFIQNDYYLGSGQEDIYIERDILVTAGCKLTIINESTLKLAPGKKIIVENGGQIDVSSGASVTFTSQSGTWGGIEFQGDSYGTLRNCTFQNTSTPILIVGDPFGSADPPDIIIDSCNFNAPIEITNRKDVTIEYCNFNYSSGTEPAVLGIFCSGSDNTLFSNNTINSASAISSTGISVIYGSGIVIQKNTINNMAVGISISNSSPFVLQNKITNSSSSSAVVGIGFDNSYSAAVKQNTVIGYQVGYKLYNSSPEMYLDSSYNTGTSGDSVNGLHAVYLSNPRLKPGESIGGVIWDAGKNDLKSVNKGNGVYMYMNSVPILDYGYNNIWGYDNYLFGDGPEVSEYYVRCNNWIDDPPVSSEFNLSLPGSVIYSPYGCTPPGGSGSSSFKAVYDPDEDIEDPENPPAFIVVNYGHEIYDTIKVTTGTNNIPSDQNIYGEALNDELTGNFTTAIAKYKNLITNHQTSLLARNSLKKILNCYVKMNADSNQFSELRNYYLSLVQQYPGDTAFVKASKELAVKTLVKKGDYVNAITEYENLITGNNDIHEVLCCELNIIETYLIMQEEGDAPGFTGNITSLKPVNKRDGYRKIMEKLYGVRQILNNPVIPVKFSLSQNYPNPFNPITKINYSLPRAVKVNIQVYDILGRLVKTLVNEFKEAGNYEVQFDGSGLASGVYFYRIEVRQAGSSTVDFIDSKKMVLVK